MEFKAKFFKELSVTELYEIVRARQEIFLMEQNIVCRDFDGVDYDALHCFIEEKGKVVAYLRAYKGDDGEVRIGRVLSIPHGIGLGRRLMLESIPIIREKFECDSISLHSQCHAKGFYKKLGFESVGEIFIEEGIPHIMMKFEF
jgi:ElaA protein